MSVTIIGGGLAGSEAAWQLARRNISVTLVEMRPVQPTPAHVTNHLAELVCTNSLKSMSLTNASGILKAELRRCGSLIMAAADASALPSGQALSVDREQFSAYIEQKLNASPNVTIERREVVALPEHGPVILATGPLTSDALSASLQELLHDDGLYFYDAVAPVIDADSIDRSVCYAKSRYDKGTADYLNCPLNREQFAVFFKALNEAQAAHRHAFEDLKLFEACQPIELMAKKGPGNLLFGPLKPVGLEEPGKKRPFAVVQLRQDDAAKKYYNLVGFQTGLAWDEQRKLIHLIPGLQDAQIVRYGVMHRNTYLNAPKHLTIHQQLSVRPDVFVAGQISGVEGYLESTASGLMAAIQVAALLHDQPLPVFPTDTMMGALARYLVSANPNHFQPMHVGFGLIDGDLSDRTVIANKAVESMDRFMHELGY